VVGVQATHNPARQPDGPRPVNLRTDLGPLADLIELAFANTMDSNGRAAVREMRTLSRMGSGLGLLSGLNDLAVGMGTGYVWIADGKLIGNVSTYPAHGEGLLKHTWVIVNVAVHPDYQRRGIAQQLMQSTMELIRTRGGQSAILQVDADNPVARRLYTRLGFIEERAWTTWRRNALTARPPPSESHPSIYISHPRTGEWQAEYQLAARVRPALAGGLGWLRPLHISQFRKSPWRRLIDWFSLKSDEHLVIRSEDEREILASMWIENSFTSSTAHLTLLVDPDYEGVYDEALLNTVVRRFGGSPLSIEHPADRLTTNALLRRYHFSPRREVVHMRWDINEPLGNGLS
jgi:ribosomal protein S18 acetylase RimI-like enzyme